MDIDDVAITCNKACESAMQLLRVLEQTAKGLDSESSIADLRRETIVDSAEIRRVHARIHAHNSERSQAMVDKYALPYNKHVVQCRRASDERVAAEKEIKRLVDAVPFSRFRILMQLLEAFDNGSLLDRAGKDAQGNPPKLVPINAIFVHPTQRDTAIIDLDTDFNKLIEVEAKLRIRLRAQCELLYVMRHQLIIERDTWRRRSAAIASFLDEGMRKIANEIAVALKAYSDESSSLLDEEEEESHESESMSDLDTGHDESDVNMDSTDQ